MFKLAVQQNMYFIDGSNHFTSDVILIFYSKLAGIHYNPNSDLGFHILWW